MRAQKIASVYVALPAWPDRLLDYVNLHWYEPVFRPRPQNATAQNHQFYKIKQAKCNYNRSRNKKPFWFYLMK